jgi:hypothetical protein
MLREFTRLLSRENAGPGCTVGVLDVRVSSLIGAADTHELAIDLRLFAERPDALGERQVAAWELQDLGVVDLEIALGVVCPQKIVEPIIWPSDLVRGIELFRANDTLPDLWGSLRLDERLNDCATARESIEVNAFGLAHQTG